MLFEKKKKGSLSSSTWHHHTGKKKKACPRRKGGYKRIVIGNESVQVLKSKNFEFYEQRYAAITLPPLRPRRPSVRLRTMRSIDESELEIEEDGDGARIR